MTAGIVLAGGRSSRMGAPKAGLDWHGSTLLGHVVGVVGRGAGPVVVVRAPGQALPALPAGVRVVEDAREGRGPLEGLRAASGPSSRPSRRPTSPRSTCPFERARTELAYGGRLRRARPRAAFGTSHDKLRARVLDGAGARGRHGSRGGVRRRLDRVGAIEAEVCTSTVVGAEGRRGEGGGGPETPGGLKDLGRLIDGVGEPGTASAARRKGGNRVTKRPA
jgi:hypothetical protein